MKGFKVRNGGFLGLYLLICLMAIYGMSLPSLQAFELTEKQGVRLSAPNGGESWVLGQTKEIKWVYTGPQAASQRWKLVLIKGQNAVGTIADNVSGDRYNWKVGQYTGGTAVLASDYKIFIWNEATAQVRDASDGFFEIKFVSVGGPLQEKKPSVKMEKKPPEMEKKPPDVERRIETPAMQLLPDLVIKEVGCKKEHWYPTGGAWGQSVNNPLVLKMYFQIANQGDGDAVEGPFARVICHQGIMICDWIPGTINFSGEKIRFKAKTETVNILWCRLPETTCRDFSVIVDPDNTIREKNEWNNEFRFTCPE